MVFPFPVFPGSWRKWNEFSNADPLWVILISSTEKLRDKAFVLMLIDYLLIEFCYPQLRVLCIEMTESSIHSSNSTSA
ncbi:hypothetical protein CEXT_23061 [Caerostris extrusa]|uniref:Uncharacterized protein n=1 Tax=Caerostris extrusa TaxID=172846 RepID=A0AAV4P6B8_CAEEX|nr:hypothetical protein CEXT_23061 [Caerostris extrusa]